MNTHDGYPLLVIQREIIGHPTRTEHWSFMIMLDSSQGEIHELQGNYDTFHYFHDREQNWAKSRDLCGGCLIGYVPQGVLPQLSEMLRGIPVIRHDPNHDCQTWVIDALRAMKDEGIAFKDMTERKLREELAAELERTETGHDVVYERMQL